MSTPMTLLKVSLLAAAVLGGCVDQPKPGCISTTSAFAVKLIFTQTR